MKAPSSLMHALLLFRALVVCIYVRDAHSLKPFWRYIEMGILMEKVSSNNGTLHFSKIVKDCVASSIV